VVPPEQAVIDLTAPRIERDAGEDIFLVDYEFTKGCPERGWQYQLVLTSDSGNEYTADHLFNETQVTGQFEGRLSHFDADDEPSRHFTGYVRMRIGSTTELTTLSNTVEFNLPDR
jgi:hypothetical protein